MNIIRRLSRETRDRLLSDINYWKLTKILREVAVHYGAEFYWIDAVLKKGLKEGYLVTYYRVFGIIPIAVVGHFNLLSWDDEGKRRRYTDSELLKRIEEERERGVTVIGPAELTFDTFHAPFVRGDYRTAHKGFIYHAYKHHPVLRRVMEKVGGIRWEYDGRCVTWIIVLGWKGSVPQAKEGTPPGHILTMETEGKTLTLNRNQSVRS